VGARVVSLETRLDMLVVLLQSSIYY